MASEIQNSPLCLETAYPVLRAIKLFPLGVMWIGVHSVCCHELGCPSDKSLLECLLSGISRLPLTLIPSPCLWPLLSTQLFPEPSGKWLCASRVPTLMTLKELGSCLFQPSNHSGQFPNPVEVFTFSYQWFPEIPYSVYTFLCNPVTRSVVWT